MRGRLRDPKVKSYNQPFQLDKTIDTLAVGVVVRSDEPSIQPGQIYKGLFACAEYAVVPPQLLKIGKIIENKEQLPWTTLLGACGMPGATAWVGLYDIGRPKKGETIFGARAASVANRKRFYADFDPSCSLGCFRRRRSDRRPTCEAGRPLCRRVRGHGRKGRLPEGDRIRPRLQL